MNQKEFGIGCDYWASHAGLSMWRRWRPDTVNRDLDSLAGLGLNFLRVFPLWPDFQPVTALHPAQYGFRERRKRRVRMAFPEYYGLDPVMLERFHFLMDAAQSRGLKLVAGLFCGRKVGRRPAPAALGNRDLIRDPECIRLEAHFIRGCMASLLNHPTLIGWDLGSDLDSLAGESGGNPLTEADTWNWLHAMISEIRLADPVTPVITGMYGGAVAFEKPWNLFQLGDLGDRLTAGSSAHQDSGFFPPALQASAEACLGTGISGKNCFVRENGASKRDARNRPLMPEEIKAALFSAWVHGRKMFFGPDAFSLPAGKRCNPDGPVLLDSDGTVTPTGKAVRDAIRFLDSLRVGNLPPRRTDAVVLTAARAQPAERACFGSFLLAKEAGFEVKFAALYKGLPESDLYILPSFDGDCGFFPQYWKELLRRIRKGATLYFSDSPACLRRFGPFLKWRVESSSGKPEEVCFEIPEGRVRCRRDETRRLTADECDAIGKDTGGNPVFLSKKVGKGRIFCLDVPVERCAVESGSDFSGIYRRIFEAAGKEPLLCGKDRSVGATAHYAGDGSGFAVCINYSNAPGRISLKGLSVSAGDPGSGMQEFLPPCGMRIFKINGKEPFGENRAADVGEIVCPDVLTPVERTDWSRTTTSDVYTLEALERRGQTIDVLFLGDSITHGWEWNRRWTHSGGYSAWDGALAKYSKVNLGISGDKVENLLWRITKGRQVDGYRARVVSLLIGTNNLLSGEGRSGNPENIVATIREILRILRLKQPRAKILLQGILPFKNKEGIRKAVLLNRKLIRLADGKTVFWLDVGRWFKNMDGALLHFRDTLHPSPEGYDILAAGLIPEFDRLLR